MIQPGSNTIGTKEILFHHQFSSPGGFSGVSRFVWAISLSLLLLSGCSINRMAVRATSTIIEEGLPALYRETDLVLARSALESNIKLLEVLLESDVGNRRLHLMLSQAYAAYSLGFIEDDDPTRAREMYRRGRDYSLVVLEEILHKQELATEPLNDFNITIGMVNRDDIEPLFWAALNWGNWIMLNLQDPQAIFDLTRVERMMSRVLELDESYYFAGPHLFFGSVLAARPVILGGKPDLALEHFNRARELTDNRFLLILIYEARFLAVQTQDEALFESLLGSVLDAPLSVLPDMALVNQISKQKARRLLDKKNDFF